MTSDPKPLPIPTYRVSMLGPNPGWELRRYDGASAELCEADDVRELVDRMEKAEARVDSARAAEVVATQERDVLQHHIDRCESDLRAREAVLSMTVARLGGSVEGGATHRGNFLQRIDELRKAEAQLDRLADLLRSSKAIFTHGRVHRDAVARISEALAAIDKENA